MRKNVLIPIAALLAVVTFFAACKKDKKDELTGRKALLVGTWVESFYADDQNENNALDEDEKEPVEAAEATTIQFKEDGTGTFTGMIEGSFTWSLSSDEQNITVTLLGSSETDRIYSIDANTFVMEDEDEETGRLNWIGHTKK